MSGASEQIVILYEQGNSPENIACMLEVQLSDVLIILNGAGKLTPKKVKQNLETQLIITGGNNSVKEETAEDAYKKYHLQIAKRLIATAMEEPSDVLPASVIQKAQLYINEEATGRNEARAKRNSVADALLLSLGEMAQRARIAQECVNKALNIPSMEKLEQDNKVVNVTSTVKVA